MERIETTILQNLIFSEEYSRKVITFIQPDYFEDRNEMSFWSFKYVSIKKLFFAAPLPLKNKEPLKSDIFALVNIESPDSIMRIWFSGRCYILNKP